MVPGEGRISYLALEHGFSNQECLLVSEVQREVAICLKRFSVLWSPVFEIFSLKTIDFDESYHSESEFNYYQGKKDKENVKEKNLIKVHHNWRTKSHL